MIFANSLFEKHYKTLNVNDKYELISYDEIATVPNSETVSVNDTVLVNERDYLINYHTSSIIIMKDNISLIKIYYSTYSKEILTTLYKYEIQNPSDSLLIKRPKKDLFENWNSQNKLSISGSKTISVSFGNQDDLSINQSMNLKINGELSENVFIDAQLNDSQSPITPEGNTRELSNLDQIYFRLYGKQYELAFGDLEIVYDDTRFINYINKFEGVKAKYYNENEAQAAVALSKSKTAIIDFYGVEGKQGPYYLKPNNFGTNVKIISGTEEIFLDSQLMQRGEDYFIDYDEGSITFLIKYIISQQNRIKATFQYSDEYYRKNLYLFENKFKITDGLSFSTHHIMSIDDKNNPISYSFSDEDIQTLKNSGDKPVYVSGEEDVGYGFGKYKKVSIANENYYVYAPEDSLARYNVSFTYVGLNQGDYDAVGIDIYEYQGIGQGSYLPFIRIIAPEYKANWDFRINLEKEFYQLNYEILLSENDKNIYSNMDSNDDNAYIHQAEIVLKPPVFWLNPILTLNYLEKKKNLFSFSDISESSDNQFYYFIAPDSLSSRSYLGKFDFTFYEALSNKFYMNLIKHDGFDRQIRLINEIDFKQQNLIPEIRYSMITGKQVVNNNIQLELHNHQINTGWQNKLAKILVTGEYLENRTTKNDTIQNAYKNEKNKIELKTKEYQYTTIGLTFSKEKRFNWQQNYQLDYTSAMYGFEGMFSKTMNTNSILYARKNIEYSRSGTNQKFDFAEYRGNNSLLKDFIQSYVNYSISNLEYYPKIRELQYVGSSLGIYDSTGVMVENGEYDWVYVQSGSPVQTVDLKADFSTILSFNKISKGSILKKLQSDTWLYVYESTKESNKYQVYLLNTDYLMKDSVTVYGKQMFKQTVWFNYIPNKLVFKYAYNKENALDNRYQSSIENRLESHEWTGIFSRYLNSDWEYSLITSNEYDSKYLLKTSCLKNELRLTYKIRNNMIINTTFLISSEKNQNQIYSWNNQQRSISEDIMIFIGDKYRINSKIDLTENKSDYSFNLYLPENKLKGMNYRWNNNVYYRFNQYTQISFEYSGSDYPQREAVHQIRMEVKAEF